MSVNVPLVFLSSTSEFDDVRGDIQAELQGDDYKVWYWKDDRARGSSAEKHCRDVLKKADVVVFLLGDTYGTDYDDRRSICEWEFDTAAAFDEPELMPFVKEGATTTADPRQQRFIARLAGDFRGGRWCKPFRDAKQIVTLVSDSVRQWRYEFYGKVKEAIPARLGKLFSVGGIALLFMASVVAGTLLTFEFTRSEILAATIAICFTVIGALALFKKEIRS